MEEIKIKEGNPPKQGKVETISIIIKPIKEEKENGETPNN